MDFKQYQYILKVAELKSITKAANDLYISQPSLSAYIAKIEDDLGVKLFDRSKTPLELTEAGKIYEAAGRQILALQAQMKSRILEISQNKKGRLKVGIPGSRATFMIPKIYPAFHSEFPEIKLDIIEDHSKNLTCALEKGVIDISIMPKSDELLAFECELIYEEELFLIAQAGYLDLKDYLQTGIANIANIFRHPIIMLRKGHGLRRTLDTFFSNIGVEPRILFETENNSTALRMALMGQGIAIVPNMTIHLSGDITNIEILRLTPGRVTWEIVAVRKKINNNDYVLNKFIAIAKQVFKANSDS